MEISRYSERPPAQGEYSEQWNYAPIRPVVEEPPVPLTHYFWVLRRHKWRIIGFVFVVVTAVLLFSLQMTRLYESIATLEIDNQSQMFEFGDAGVRFDSRSFETLVTTQIEVMDSPEVAEQVIRELRLDRHPDFNPALRKRSGGASLANALAPASAERAQVAATLPGLTIRRRPDTYLLEVRYRNPNPELAAAIANASARAFVQRGFMTQYQNSAELSRWLNRQLEEIKAKLERSQQAVRAFEKQHNVVSPEDRTNLLNLQLQHLQEELTKARAERLRKESAYSSIEAGGLESLAISEQGEPLLKLAERLESLDLDLADAASRLGPNHPDYKRLEGQRARTRDLLETNKQKALNRLAADYRQTLAKENALAEAVLEQKAELDRLGTWAAEYQILKGEVDSQTKVYEALLKKVNEASINASIKATNLRLAGLASTPREPVSPKVKLNVLLAFLIATTVAIGAALAADYLDRTLRSSEQVEQWLRLPVLASLPRVPGKGIQTVLLGANGDEGESRAVAKSGTALSEALNMLRTSVLLSAPANELQMVLVASAAPAEGKSTVAIGFALALANQLENGHRVLLVDSDLRRPTVHNIFGLPNRIGLSTILEGQTKLADSILPSGSVPNLMVLPAGPCPRHSSELLTMHMAKLLETIRQEYRYVVIDSAPILVCADATILSTMSDAVIMVARAGETPRDAVGAALRQLRRARANVVGLALNQVRLPDLHGYGTYYTGYYYNRPEEV